MKKNVYIALDVEAAGPHLDIHSTLSVGACVVTPEPLAFDEYTKRGLVFYAELQPISFKFHTRAMRIGASHIEAVETARLDAKQILMRMLHVCESRRSAALRMKRWAEKAAFRKKIVGLTDTVFFDSARINALFGEFSIESPFGHTGLDLDSVYRGYTQHERANLSELGIPAPKKPHHALHDAVHLSQQASVLFKRMGWL